MVIVATIPIVIIGFLAKDLVTHMLRSTEIIAWMTLIFAFVLWAADRVEPTRETTSDITLGGALIVGFMQCLAIVPGVSRSGITMTAGRYLGFDRPLSARFALLLSVPTIAAAGMLVVFDLYEAGDAHLTADALVGGVLSFVSALTAIALMMRWLRHASYMPFIVYRVALGILLLVLIYGFGWAPVQPA
jgi:undecaprenyl-diphosphatase